ncbi:glycosyltransferase family 2 protein [Mucilaginibacter sp. McL0603]|uniref:glycosyltransferase family 2 protein n=1 Tax=Mucilaginibacter sp. McL0603 TaxID=3415670 RepID=UPI003CF9106C
MPTSIDVVIPSFRLEEKYILPILQLNVPDSAIIKFYLVADNPKLEISPLILALVDNKKIFLTINQENMGAALTRNTGIDQGKGDWILFLDDDIAVKPDLLNTYVDAIANYPDEIGFIGLVKFTDPSALFDKAIKASGSVDIFNIAERKSSFAWGATANIIVNRAAIREIRFDKVFPKSGGAEDIDFFLKVRERNQFKNYRSLPLAEVEHPWWNAGKPNFKRSFRYGKGSSFLFRKDTDYTYYDFLNTTETIFIVLIALLVSVFVSKLSLYFLLLFLAGILVIEFIANIVQSLKRKAGLNLVVVFYLVLLRLSYQWGLLLNNLLMGRFNALGMRFNDDGSFKKSHFYRLNSYKITKWVLYSILVYILIRNYS